MRVCSCKAILSWTKQEKKTVTFILQCYNIGYSCEEEDRIHVIQTERLKQRRVEQPGGGLFSHPVTCPPCTLCCDRPPFLLCCWRQNELVWSPSIQHINKWYQTASSMLLLLFKKKKRNGTNSKRSGGRCLVISGKQRGRSFSRNKHLNTNVTYYPSTIQSIITIHLKY